MVQSNKSGKTPEAIQEDSESLAPSAKVQKTETKDLSSEHESTNFASSENYNLYSGFSVFGLQNYELVKHREVLQTNFHARMMHVLHPDLKVNQPLDMHFLKHLKQHKSSLLDENGQM